VNYSSNLSSSPLNLESSVNVIMLCERCGEVCRGEVVRVKNTHFHVHCFTCQVCGCDLVHSGFFHHSGEYICTQDYQRLYGTQCDSCEQYITGEVVSSVPHRRQGDLLWEEVCVSAVLILSEQRQARQGPRAEL
uniref:Actin binding LIM protein family, member 3 n=1 Tax=Cynoglossus semilaevis TaxID=244447 RepID=A0A3P8X2D2_CYNSE